MSASADLVRRLDPDRFAAVLRADSPDRARLVTLYALNLEIARAPLASAEPMLALMRLQWWADALTTPTQGQGAVLDEYTAAWGQDGTAVVALVDGRRRDVDRDPFTSKAELLDYIDATAGTVMRLAASALGGAPHDVIAAQARGSGLAAWLRALPQLQAIGLGLAGPDPAALAQIGLAALDQAATQRRTVPARAAPALYAGAGARRSLQAIAQQKTPALSEGALRLSRLHFGLTGRWW